MSKSKSQAREQQDGGQKKRAPGKMGGNGYTGKKKK